jgi:hypothetical protein
MKKERSYVSITKHGAGWDYGCLKLTINELESIINDAKLKGATKVEVSAGRSACLWFYRLQNDEEYNAELQEKINEELAIVDKMKSELIS